MRSRLLRAAAAVIILAGLLLFPNRVHAAGPLDTVRSGIEEVRSVFQKPNIAHEERASLLRRIAHQRFAFDEMAKRALGARWKTLAPEQKREFTEAFTSLIEDSYRRKIERYEREIREHSEDRVLYLSEKQEGARALVKTRIVTLNGTSVPVDYRLVEQNGAWLAYDVVVEGISLLQNYRSQFRTILQQHSLNELMHRMRAKNVEEK